LNSSDLGSGALVLVFGTCFSVPAENQFPYLGCFAVLFTNVWQIDDLLSLNLSALRVARHAHSLHIHPLRSHKMLFLLKDCDVGMPNRGS
jgi:hypothetical protein